MPRWSYSALLPSIDFGNDSVAIWQSPIQGIDDPESDFDFGHVQPARVFWCVVKYDATQEGCCFFNTEHFLEALTEVGVEIVHDQMDAACFAINLFEQISDESHEVRYWCDGR